MFDLGFATEAIIRDVIGGVIGQESIDLNTAVADGEAVSSMVPKDMASVDYEFCRLTYDSFSDAY